MESMSAEFMKEVGSDKAITPFMDELAQKSLLFFMLYVTGNRAVRCMEVFILSIPLHCNKDELYYLSETINSLLNRIQNAIEREKKFTSDASHELRTPLAIIKGTLEVLIRKPREKQEYEDKVNFCIREVDAFVTW